MSDAAKYAKVFRAAADGVLDVMTLGKPQEQRALREPHAFGWTRREAIGWLFRDSPGQAASWGAYDGVATMFEKIAEAEASA